ncbi:MAG TPA: T9SS type A sorting domain-containing protein, partial [Bacteroidia bacterium]|nr:T9SS type A sorting domain-containing protein [Bacteroidia bacterium]
ESVNATGGNASGSGGTVAYSVGQVVYTTNSDSTGSVSQGVQQAYEIYTVGIKETKLTISLSVFPNPTANNLTLQVQDYNNKKLSYQLFDMQGKLLSSETIAGAKTQINMSGLPTATYFVHVIEDNKKVQTFKIIKIK